MHHRWMAWSPSCCLLLAGILTTSLSAPSDSREEIAFYVSLQGNDSWSGLLPGANDTGTDGPFASLRRARDSVRSLKRQGALNRPVTVYVRGGTHFLQEPLVFLPEDSGSSNYPITYRPYLDERAAISGGRRISVWKQGRNGTWFAELPGEGTLTKNFRTLWVNGRSHPRTRLPKDGFYRVAEVPGVTLETPVGTPSDRFLFRQGDLRGSWTNLKDIEIVAVHFWVSPHLPVASIDESKREVTFQKKTRWRLTENYTKIGARYYVTNVFEAMDEPGEWYFDRSSGVLYYIPMPGEDMNEAEIIAPRLENLVRFEGRPEEGKYVENIVLRGLVFRHNDWQLPSDDCGDWQASYRVPGAIHAEGARRCAIEGCTLTQLSTYAIELGYGCSEIRISDNNITGIGGGGIKISGGNISSRAALRTGGNQISNNRLSWLGEVFHGSAGILLMHTASNLISHNEIQDLYYSGISLGWVWGYGANVSGDNRIEFNSIHNIGKGMLADLGGIYVLGESDGTVVWNNRIHDVEARDFGGWGIYLDEGASRVLVENNVVYRTMDGNLHHHFGRENTIRNNIFALSRMVQIVRSRADDHMSLTFERNIVYWSNGPLLGAYWHDDNYRFDRNLYYRTGIFPIYFGKWSFEEWQGRGQDRNSYIEDPLFVDPENDNFELRENSPAQKIGFRPIDQSRVGPQ